MYTCVYIYQIHPIFEKKGLLKIEKRSLELGGDARQRLHMNMYMCVYICRIHRRFMHKGDTSTHAQGTDPRVALGA